MFGASILKTAESTVVKSVTSYLSPDLEVVGDIQTTSSVVVDGTVTGNIVADRLTISAEARIAGDVTASEVAVSGYIEGKFTGGRVSLETTAEVVGVILYDILAVRPGAHVDGHLQRKLRPFP